MRASIIALIAASVATVACGSTAPSPELMSARDAYDRARRSDAARYEPDSVLAAKQALQVAERAHEDSPRSTEEKSYAYVARRRAELAMVQGTTARERAEKQRSEQDYVAVQEELRTKTQAELAATQSRVQNLNNQLERQTERVAVAQNETERERKARLEAEARAQRALESLHQIAQVKEESRGTVITLSGQVLFVTGKAELLPAARDKLTEVAKAINDSGDERPITVEGHTDSRGNENMNQQLSQARAQSVRDYLVTLGVKPDRIKAVGRGEAQPVASNDNPEGRANNRRVEIIIGGAAGSRSGSTPGQTMTPASGG